MSIFSKIFGDPNQKEITKMQPAIDQVNQLEKKFEQFSDTQFKEQTQKWQSEIKKIKTAEEEKQYLEKILPQAFAIVREASKRTLKERHFDVQIMGAIALHQGKVIEMRTGEGKTLSATMPAYLNALTGKGVHIVTVNDYLARRDTEWMGRIFYLLGLNTACIQHDIAMKYDPNAAQKQAEENQKIDQAEMGDQQNSMLVRCERKQAYLADITYGTNSEFGFDYLRDNMARDLNSIVQKKLNYAIVDEVDSILIDEARTPLIISAPDAESTNKYYEFAKVVQKLEENNDYNIDEKLKASTLTENGIKKLEKILNVQNIYEERGIQTVHHLEQALRAMTLFKRDRDYLVKDGQVVIVDEFTGRLMPGRRYSEGLHQAIEAKESVEVQRESRTLATISLQNYFRLYSKLAGMTGTAATEAEEFKKIYNLEVIIIPTNKPMIRKDANDVIYKTEKAKFQAVVQDIIKLHKKGQPVLVGTISVAKSELLSSFLKKENTPHEVLNAKNHEREAKIIAKAGQKSAITIATNMAGRGTDIKLGKDVVNFGGLHVVGTERHESRRIDNQLRGRGGRQGDPGSSQFYISLEDDLMRIFASDRVKMIMNKLGLPDDQPIGHSLISRSIESAQKKVEGNNFDIRKHLVEYDDVLNKQREIIYQKRRKTLGSSLPTESATKPNLAKKMNGTIKTMIENEIEDVVIQHTMGDRERDWNIQEVSETMNSIIDMPKDSQTMMEDLRKKAGEKGNGSYARTAIIEYLMKLIKAEYKSKKATLGKEMLANLERFIILRVMDNLWMEYLSTMEYLRESVRLRAYGQKDPLVEYKREGFEMFQNLLKRIQSETVHTFFKIQIEAQPNNAILNTNNINETQGIAQKPNLPEQTTLGGRHQEQLSYTSSQNTTQKQSPAINAQKAGRNNPCPCGSGKKYKKCCLER